MPVRNRTQRRVWLLASCATTAIHSSRPSPANSSTSGSAMSRPARTTLYQLQRPLPTVQLLLPLVLLHKVQKVRLLTICAHTTQNFAVVTPPQPISAPAAPPPPRTGAAAAIAALSPTTATSATSNGPPRTFKTDGITFSTTGDKTRDKCTEMVYDALAWDSGARESCFASR